MVMDMLPFPDATAALRARFAPSPTGYLHLGHVRSAVLNWQVAAASGGVCVPRIEDIDTGRSKPAYEHAILADLRWLGFDWPEPVRRQSDHFDDYAAAIDALQAQGLLYPCFCSRADIRRAGAVHGPDGPLYPGTCRGLDPAIAADRIARGDPYALRIDLGAAMARVGTITWTDDAGTSHRADPSLFGDLLIRPRLERASYHLAVVVDDAAQGITHVIRGGDLARATHVHRVLQALLGLPTPLYHHHALIMDGAEKLSKRDGATGIRELRAAGISPDEVIRRALADTS